ncbi:MAG: glycoside hydrolase, partial [Acidobacteriaceae bacterium]|nr:glycoside hydrolase [Acidobacteriaceae bacterium]
TWLHSPVFRATPLDMKAEADRHFIEGINQLIGHGWPYSPPSAEEPGWRFYAAAAFNDHNPWFQVMPEITRYMQRVSFLLRQGQPANDIAVYLPTDDAWAHLQPGKVAVDEMTDTLLGPVLIPEVLNAGYNFDFIDDRAMAKAGIPYKVLILPGVERIPLGTMQRLQGYAAKGGMLVATRSLPALGPGLLEEKRDSTRIAAISHELFETGSPRARFVEQEQNVSAALKEMLPPDFAAGNAGPALGFVHRKLAGAEIYFVANASNHTIETEASIRSAGQQPEWWDPLSGEIASAVYAVDGTRTKIGLTLAPYESRVLVFCNGGQKAPNAHPERATDSQPIDVTSDWKVTYAATGRSVQMTHLRSWTSDEETRFYSGEAVYEKGVKVPLQWLAKRSRVFLDFGPGTPVEPNASITPGMHALLESPVRESAIVFVNGARAGTVWHPPYEVDTTRYLRAGENTLRLVVANLAINEMAGQALPDYRLLNLRYGERFLPQDMQDVKPLPSGIVGTVRLVGR